MHKNGIRALLSVASILLAAFCGTAQSQPYPSKPVKFIVPFPPGGNLDFVARTLSAAIAKLNEALVKTLALPEVREKFATQGLDAPSGKVARTANIKLD